jgi:hypothetical protein
VTDEAITPESTSVWLRRGVDVTVAHPARRYDYWLGGKDHFPADRASGDAVAAAFPTIRTAARENRWFLGRAVRHLAEHEGIDQFLDIGTGIPAAENTHEVAQRINPASRVVYVDNDPIVLAHARALLTSTHADGLTAYLDADVRDPGRILDDAALTGTLDLSRPVALMLVAVLHFVFDEDRPYDVVRWLLGALAPGSFLVLSHATNDLMPLRILAEVEAVTRSQGGYRPRTRREFCRFFDGLDLLEPGVVPLSDWRADGEPAPRPSASDVGMYGAVGRI